MFAFLTGYVCAIKPLRQAKSGDKSAALTTLAKSAFRRPPRLILPSTIAIMFAWVFAQLGGFEVAIRCDSEWLRNSSVKNVNGLSSEIPRLFRELHKNWVENHNTYDDHQWALNPLLLGAFTVYLTLAATIYMKNKWRTIVLASLTLWYWFDYTPFVGMCFPCIFCIPQPTWSQILTQSKKRSPCSSSTEYYYVTSALSPSSGNSSTDGVKPVE